MKEREPETDSELELNARLLRSLAHRIRGDLAVITNDLVYLAALCDPRELERPRTRCESIAALLATVTVLSPGNVEGRIACSELAELCGVACDAPALESTGHVVISAALIRRAVGFLRDLLGPWSGALELSKTGGISHVTCVLRFSEGRRLERGYSSLARLAAAELGEKLVVEGSLFDLIMRDHRVDVSFRSYDVEVIGTLAFMITP